MLDKNTRELIDRIKSEEIRYKVFRKRFDGDNNYLNYVFICGGNLENYTSRNDLLKIFEGKFNCLISENLDALISDLDLLTFERILESISQVILISLESFGTACELGAFTYLADAEKNENREIVIFDTNHKNDESFITKGPIKLLQDLNDKRVIYTKFSRYREGLAMEPTTEIRELYKHKLLLDKRKLKTFYVSRKNGVIAVSDLSSFFAYLIDIFCFFGYCDFYILMEFIDRSLNCKKIVLETSGIKSTAKLQPIIECFLRIMERMEILEKKGQYYFVKEESVVKCFPNSMPEVGKIIFTKKFLNSKKCSIYKSQCIQLKRKLYDC